MIKNRIGYFPSAKLGGSCSLQIPKLNVLSTQGVMQGNVNLQIADKGLKDTQYIFFSF